MGITVKDVAGMAGVSTATVSRVINNEKGIRLSTREKVLEAVKVSGYRVNTFARSLKTNKSRTIGLISPEIANDFFMNIARGVEGFLERFGYSLIICNTNESAKEELRRSELLIEKNVDGVIIIPATKRGTHFSLLRDAGIPFVFADRLTSDYNGDAVLVDNQKGSFEAISWLIEQGHSNIAFIGGSPELSNARERYAGYLQALEKYKIKKDERLILTGNFHVDSGYRLMEQLVGLNDPPEQVFIANYFMHVGAIKYLISNSLEPDVSPGIGSFDDLELSSILGYASVSVAQPVEEIGSKAAEILLSRINGDVSPENKILRLHTKLRISL
ncbi:MAG: LacI family transcriptional regulator [Spirochaetales bacterium]|nr:LacI family transcriptional regulator [Spirochaetales bacterium]